MYDDATAFELRDFFLQGPMPFAILIGPNHEFSLANAAYEKLVGRKVLGKTVKDLFTIEEIKDYLPILDKVFLSETSFIGNEMPFSMTDHNEISKKLWINVAYYPFHEADGKMKGVITFINDVTDVVNAKNAIKQSENHFRLLSNSLPNMIWTATPEGKTDWYSDAWYKYTGTNEKSMIENKWSLIVHPDDIGVVSEQWNNAIKKEALFKKEIRLKKVSTDQYRWHLCLGIPVKDEDGNILRWIGSYTDIHDQKITVQNLEEERDLKEVFVSTLSHDLRTSLTVAKLTSQILVKKFSNEPTVLRSARRIAVNMDRADEMIQNLLDASLIKGGGKLFLRIDYHCLNDLMKTIVEDLSSVYGDRFKVESSQNIEGFWDYGGLRRVFENLLMNAVKYGANESLISISINSLNNMAEVKIHNEGEQINPAELDMLFSRFKRLENSRTGHQKGWGLGLTLVKGLTEAHGGTVHAMSLEKEGTTFTVSIPFDSRKFGKNYDEENG